MERTCGKCENSRKRERGKEREGKEGVIKSEREKDIKDQDKTLFLPNKILWPNKKNTKPSKIKFNFPQIAHDSKS